MKDRKVAAKRGASKEGRTVTERTAAPPVPAQPITDDMTAASALFQSSATASKIQKSELTISEPRRHRDKGHLKFVASHPCLVCGRSPSDAHHLHFTQPRALGRKVSDEFTVPLCRTHHRDNHRHGNELAWWVAVSIDPVEVSRRFWESTRGTSRVDSLE